MLRIFRGFGKSPRVRRETLRAKRSTNLGPWKCARPSTVGPRSSADRAADFESACGGSTPPGAIRATACHGRRPRRALRQYLRSPAKATLSPSATVQIRQEPRPGWLAKAILRPSGDQSGLMVGPRPVRSARRAPTVGSYDVQPPLRRGLLLREDDRLAVGRPTRTIVGKAAPPF